MAYTPAKTALAAIDRSTRIDTSCSSGPGPATPRRLTWNTNPGITAATVTATCTHVSGTIAVPRPLSPQPCPLRMALSARHWHQTRRAMLVRRTTPGAVAPSTRPHGPAETTSQVEPGRPNSSWATRVVKSSSSPAPDHWTRYSRRFGPDASAFITLLPPVLRRNRRGEEHDVGTLRRARVPGVDHRRDAAAAGSPRRK